jgi:SAM-dependent methyltransferase
MSNNPACDPQEETFSCRVCGAAARTVLRLLEAPVFVQRLLRPDGLAEDRSCRLMVCACPACGLVQLGEYPEVVYSTDYLCSVNFSAHSRAYQSALAQRWAHDHGLARQQVLEIGSGDGFFADLLTAHGCEMTLLDPAPRACQAARQRGHRRVLEGNLTTAVLPGAPFDAVVARHVLEHVPQPVVFLEQVRAQLKPEGKVFLEVPNLDGIIDNKRFQDFYAEHLSYFDPGSLTSVLARAGYEVKEIFTIEEGDYLVAVARAPRWRLQGMLDDLADFRTRFQTLAKESREQGRRLAVWGAGGRGVALYALVRAQDLGIAYVVDSDPNKHGCFTPVSHLPVVSPARLQSDPVDDLLIVASAFQGEILRELKGFAGNGRRIGILQPEPRWLTTA